MVIQKSSFLYESKNESSIFQDNVISEDQSENIIDNGDYQQVQVVIDDESLAQSYADQSDAQTQRMANNLPTKLVENHT